MGCSRGKAGDGMSAAIQPIPQSFVDEHKVRRILGLHGNMCTALPELKLRVLGSEWCWARDFHGRGWWVHLGSEKCLAASGQWPLTEGQKRESDVEQ